jgi:enoyl-[acyl-carrier-protein] reductase (NADH)
MEASVLLNARTAIVYGASGAVGGAVARAFAREGARVILAARRREPLEEVANDITSNGSVAEVLPIDATDARAVTDHLDAVAKRFGPVNLMFNAISWDDTQGQMLTEMPFDLFFAPIQIGLTSTHLWKSVSGSLRALARREPETNFYQRVLAQVANAAVLLASDLAAGMTATMANATGGALID